MERDSAAFRSLVAKVMNLGALEIEDGWIEDGNVQVFKFVTKPVRLWPVRVHISIRVWLTVRATNYVRNLYMQGPSASEANDTSKAPINLWQAKNKMARDAMWNEPSTPEVRPWTSDRFCPDPNPKP